MCRSQAQGGRRCSGKGRGGSHVVPGMGAGAVASSSTSSGVPSRERVDQMAAGYEGRKDSFGDPLDERTRRLYALRDSGYTGSIGKDGYPADPNSEDAQTLAYMATIARPTYEL